MADAAYAILTRESATTSGNFFIDEEVLKQAGVTDFAQYSVVPGSRQLLPDLFL
jgi:citronellol/citronellal dehydrogenase